MNHYKYIELVSDQVTKELGLIRPLADFLSCDGDKCEGYKYFWQQNNVPFHHGVVCYLLAIISPFTIDDRSNIKQWVVDLYNNQLKDVLQKIDKNIDFE